MLIYDIIVILIFIYIRNKYSKIDNFANYKKITVTPSATIYKGYILYGITNHPIYKNLLQSIKKIYPISTI